MSMVDAVLNDKIGFLEYSAGLVDICLGKECAVQSPSWLFAEYGMDVPDFTFFPDFPLSICVHLNLNNSLPLILFFVIGLLKIAAHKKETPKLYFSVWGLFLFLIVFQIAGLGNYSCGRIKISFFAFHTVMNFYEPGFVEMFSTMTGFMAFILSSPYVFCFGFLSVACLFFEKISMRHSGTIKRVLLWSWFWSPIVFVVPFLCLVSLLENPLALRVPY